MPRRLEVGASRRGKGRQKNDTITPNEAREFMRKTNVEGCMWDFAGVCFPSSPTL